MLCDRSTAIENLLSISHYNHDFLSDHIISKGSQLGLQYQKDAKKGNVQCLLMSVK